MNHLPERHRATFVFLVDPGGRLLLQLRDAQAPAFPNQWSVPGGVRTLERRLRRALAVS